MQAPTALTAPDLAAIGSPEGRAWMATVPSLLHDLARQWNLTIAGDRFWSGCHAVVFPVRQGSRPLALKLAWPAGQTWAEADALAKRIRAAIEAKQRAGETAVFTCSSLKRSYRDILRAGDKDVIFVYLKGTEAVLHERLGTRTGHFFDPSLLKSQLDTLEEPGPDEAIEVSIDLTPEQIVDEVMKDLETR